MPERRTAACRRALVAAGLAVAAWGGAGGTPAQDLAARLLPPERAFALSARGLDERTIEAQFAIADGYYLYRNKLRFSVDPERVAAAPELPAGKMKKDEFFGEVEIYRGRLVVRLPIEGAVPGRPVTLRTESQGCADAGVCYPVYVQSVKVGLPGAGGRPGEMIEANPARKSWFK